VFTGLIQDVGTLLARQRRAGLERLDLRPRRLDCEDLELGESVAVNGACLTVCGASAGSFTVEVSPETLRRTTLGRLAPGAQVHLERALRLGDRLGGHVVQGHVDGVGTLRQAHPQQRGAELSFACPSELSLQLVEKGSVAVDGVSLTVFEVGPVGFTVSVVPHTLSETLLGQLRPGAAVNIELDVLGKYVRAALRRGLAPLPAAPRGRPAAGDSGGASAGLLAALGAAGFGGLPGPGGGE